MLLRHSSSCFRRQSTSPSFPKEMTLHAASCTSPSDAVQVAVASQPGVTLPHGTATPTHWHPPLVCGGSWHPSRVPPLVSSSGYPCTPLKPRAGAAAPAARCHVGTEYSVWDNTKIAVHTLLFRCLQCCFLKYHPGDPFLVILSYIPIIVTSQILPVI